MNKKAFQLIEVKTRVDKYNLSFVLFEEQIITRRSKNFENMIMIVMEKITNFECNDNKNFKAS